MVWTFCKNQSFVGFWKRCFHSPERIFCHTSHRKGLFTRFIFTISEKKKTIFRFFKSMFLLPTKACFLTRTSTNTISRCIFYKTEKLTKFKIFDPNKGVTLLEKWEFCDFFLNRCFHSPASLVYYIKRQKRFFHDLFSRCLTWG